LTVGVGVGAVGPKVVLKAKPMTMDIKAKLEKAVSFQITNRK